MFPAGPNSFIPYTGAAMLVLDPGAAGALAQVYLSCRILWVVECFSLHLFTLVDIYGFV
jgi:hypothetical protein